MSPIERSARRQRAWLTVAVAALAAITAGVSSAASHDSRLRPSLSARFEHVSYVPGQRADLLVRSDVRRLELQVLRAGAERSWSSAGRAWGPRRALTVGHSAWTRIAVRVGAWPGGVYFARVTTPGGTDVAYAPLVVRPSVLGGNRVAVVLPTYSWQAYNFFDANADGRGDSWYVDAHRHSVLLDRPFAGDGKPPHYRTQQRGFLRFLVHTGKHADYLTDEDLELIGSGDDLARLYDLVVFSGHEEYVTQHIYDVTQRFRDLGGNLAFLSADNFFWRVDLVDRRLWRIRLWRELGRPEAQLVGVQYRANDRGGHAAPYVVASSAAAPWLFAGLDVADGTALGTARYGIEFDMLAPESPPTTRVLATVTPTFGGGVIQGQMTYYETPEGAKVFASGTLGFGGSDNPVAARLFENLWQHLAVP